MNDNPLLGFIVIVLAMLVGYARLISDLSRTH